MERQGVTQKPLTVQQCPRWVPIGVSIDVDLREAEGGGNQEPCHRLGPRTLHPRAATLNAAGHCSSQDHLQRARRERSQSTIRARVGLMARMAKRAKRRPEAVHTGDYLPGISVLEASTRRKSRVVQRYRNRRTTSATCTIREIHAHSRMATREG